MGGGQSSFAKLPPIIREEPYPPQRGIDGLSDKTALNCQNCNMSIAKGISTSTVKILREYGTVTMQECSEFSKDIQRVRSREMAFREFKRNLQAGKYLRQI